MSTSNHGPAASASLRLLARSYSQKPAWQAVEELQLPAITLLDEVFPMQLTSRQSA